MVKRHWPGTTDTESGCESAAAAQQIREPRPSTNAQANIQRLILERQVVKLMALINWVIE
jgi:hypothetical protein